MREHVVFVPISTLSPLTGGLRAVPAFKTLFTELESRFDLEILDNEDPYGHEGGPPGQRPHETIAQTLGALRDGVHLVVMGSHAPAALVALDGLAGVGSFTTLGFHPTMAMMRSAGLATTADAYQGALLGRDRVYAFIRQLFQGLDEKTLRDMVNELDAKTDPHGYRAYIEWREALDPVRDRPTVKPPTLYLQSSLDIGPKLFLQLVPHAEVERLETFPTRMHHADSGAEAAHKIIPFIERHAASPIPETVRN